MKHSFCFQIEQLTEEVRDLLSHKEVMGERMAQLEEKHEAQEKHAEYVNFYLQTLNSVYMGFVFYRNLTDQLRLSEKKIRSGESAVASLQKEIQSLKLQLEQAELSKTRYV
jgi:chromosome segregation ATPase